MKRIAVIIANGSEEIEAITPIDLLRRTNAQCDVFAVGEKTVKCSHGVSVTADYTIDNFDYTAYDGIVIPGGMPGATNIANCEKAIEGIKNLFSQGKLVSAICASPAVVLASHGLTKGKKATCYPASEFIKLIEKQSIYTGENVTVDNNLITANGPKSAMEFALAICNFLEIEPKF